MEAPPLTSNAISISRWLWALSGASRIKHDCQSDFSKPFYLRILPRTENRRIRVLGKGNKVGIVPFSPKTAKALWAWLILRKTRAKTDRLWTTEEGEAFAVEGLVTWFKRLKKRAGVNGPGGVHRLRHTAGLQYLRGAKDSFLLQLFLRHESLEMSRRYTRGLKAEEAIQAHRNRASPVESLGLG
jgi:integrase